MNCTILCRCWRHYSPGVRGAIRALWEITQLTAIFNRLHAHNKSRSLAANPHRVQSVTFGDATMWRSLHASRSGVFRAATGHLLFLVRWSSPCATFIVNWCWISYFMCGLFILPHYSGWLGLFNMKVQLWHILGSVSLSVVIRVGWGRRKGDPGTISFLHPSHVGKGNTHIHTSTMTSLSDIETWCGILRLRYPCMTAECPSTGMADDAFLSFFLSLIGSFCKSPTLHLCWLTHSVAHPMCKLQFKGRFEFCERAVVTSVVDENNSTVLRSQHVFNLSKKPLCPFSEWKDACWGEVESRLDFCQATGNFEGCPIVWPSFTFHSHVTLLTR